jgi:hypothetical protein
VLIPHPRSPTDCHKLRNSSETKRFTNALCSKREQQKWEKKKKKKKKKKKITERKNFIGKDGNNVLSRDRDDWLDHETQEECALL